MFTCHRTHCWDLSLLQHHTCEKIYFINCNIHRQYSLVPRHSSPLSSDHLQYRTNAERESLRGLVACHNVSWRQSVDTWVVAKANKLFNTLGCRLNTKQIVEHTTTSTWMNIMGGGGSVYLILADVWCSMTCFVLRHPLPARCVEQHISCMALLTLASRTWMNIVGSSVYWY